jgi:hypothetical protein
MFTIRQYRFKIIIIKYVTCSYYSYINHDDNDIYGIKIFNSIFLYKMWIERKQLPKVTYTRFSKEIY